MRDEMKWGVLEECHDSLLGLRAGKAMEVVM